MQEMILVDKAEYQRCLSVVERAFARMVAEP